MQLPVLYSFRRCPYAMRARLALAVAEISVELREIVLRDKPAAMLTVSPKGTVPVLVLNDAAVIDESLDVMHWALQQSDPQNWLGHGGDELIAACDDEFKTNLDCYKYADRYPEHTADFYRQQCERFILRLENLLSAHTYLMVNQISFADIAIFPFVRQFASVDRDWFDQATYPKVHAWLTGLCESALFKRIMRKIPVWQEDDAVLVENWMH